MDKTGLPLMQLCVYVLGGRKNKQIPTLCTAHAWASFRSILPKKSLVEVSRRWSDGFSLPSIHCSNQLCTCADKHLPHSPAVAAGVCVARGVIVLSSLGLFWRKVL